MGVAVRRDGQRLVRAVDADNRGIAHGLGTVDRVAHHMAVILLPNPTFGRHVGRGHEPEERLAIVFGLGILREIERCTRFRFHPRPIIVRRIFGERRDGDIADHFTELFQHHAARIGGHADHFRVQVVFGKDRLCDVFLAGLQHHEHALLALAQHDLIGGHAFFALGYGVEIHLDADAALVGHFHRRRCESRCPHILNGLNRVGGH